MSQDETRLIQASRIDNGQSVYLTACDAWTADITIAEHLPPEDHGWRLEFANRLPEVTNARLVAGLPNPQGVL